MWNVCVQTLIYYLGFHDSRPDQPLQEEVKEDLKALPVYHLRPDTLEIENF